MVRDDIKITVVRDVSHGELYYRSHFNTKPLICIVLGECFEDNGSSNVQNMIVYI